VNGFLADEADLDKIILNKSWPFNLTDSLLRVDISLTHKKPEYSVEYSG
jgi:hypothetical protein